MKIKVPKKVFLRNNFALSGAEDNTTGPFLKLLKELKQFLQEFSIDNYLMKPLINESN